MDIRSAQFLISSVKPAGCPKADRPEYAFIGRSNVGKSSLINMLTGQKNLAKVSGTPGKTTLINHFSIRSANAAGKITDWYLVDLPGYGYAKRSQSQRSEWERMIAAYLNERENLITLFVLIDSRHNPQAADIAFLEKLGEWEVPFNLVFTKADKSTQREVSAHVRQFVNRMKEDWEFIPRNFITSTIKGMGRRELLAYIESLNASLRDSEA
ncbi:MAG: YihA family ribosome biogenesis GTP-binding protein [Bacteroidetes bacterium]|nr:YihA family ribosome biogenesis GTP-binding protein [Bacteroidota bacterium]